MAAYHRNVTPWPEDGAGTRSGGCRMFWLQGEKTMRRSGLFLVLTVLLWAVSGVGMAQDRPAPVNWDSALNAVTRQLGDPRMDDTGFAALRGEQIGRAHV